ncbi:MAG: hypothetical protein VX792_18685 [Candidatus Latescibacterota bacterium]|nr:hypothetical protein [Candidatus Latescibacterota bacterium]
MRHYLHRVELPHDEVPDFGIYPLCLDAVAVAWGFNAEGGSRNVHFLRTESFFNVATHIE